MRKNILIIGVVITVIGLVLLGFAGLPESFEYKKELPKSWDIPSKYYVYYNLDISSKTKIDFFVSSNNTVNFLVMDVKNYNLFEAGEPFDTLYNQVTTKDVQFTYEPSKADTYYFVIDNASIFPVSASVSYNISYGTLTILSYVAVVLIFAGVSIAVRGYSSKPLPKVPDGLLDLVKSRGRVRIDLLAQELRTTEDRVEIGVYELMRKGDPIRFEAETREVIYG